MHRRAKNAIKRLLKRFQVMTICGRSGVVLVHDFAVRRAPLAHDQGRSYGVLAPVCRNMSAYLTRLCKIAGIVKRKLPKDSAMFGAHSRKKPLAVQHRANLERIS